MGDLVQLRSQYHGSVAFVATYVLVGRDETHGTIRHAHTKQERRVPITDLRWSGDQKDDEWLELLQKGEFSEAEHLLNSDPLLDIQGTHSRPSIHFACYLPGPKQRLHAKLDWLLARGVDINQKTERNILTREGRSALAQAADDNDVIVAQALLDRGASLSEATNEDDHDILSVAASSGSFGMMGWLLRNGAEPSPTLPHLEILQDDDSEYNPITFTPTFSGGLHLPPLHRAVLSEYASEEDAEALFDHFLFHCPGWISNADGLSALDVAHKRNPENARILGAVIARIEASEIEANTPKSASIGAKVRL